MVPVRYAIVGFGGIAENRIAKEGFGLDKRRFNGNKCAELVAACDNNGERKEAAESLGLSWYSDFDTMLSEASVDAVIIATNNRSHAPLAKKVLSAGKHVFLEKPAGTSLDEVSELISMAGQKGLSIGIDHMMKQNTLNILARDMIRKKEIGVVEHLVLHMEFSFGMVPQEAATWRCAEPKEFGGPIGDVGSHCFYMAEFLLDDTIESLQCVYAPKHSKTAVEDGALVYAVTRSGTSCTIRVAFDQNRGGLAETISNFGFEAYGSGGALMSKGTLFQLSGFDDEPVSQSLLKSVNGKITECTGSQPQNIYQKQIEEHALSITNAELFTGVEALHNLELILLSHQSAANGGKSVIAVRTGKGD